MLQKKESNMARFPKKRNYRRPTHRDKYPIRDSRYFLDKSITKCVFCFEPASDTFQGLDVCADCLKNRQEKGQFSHKIYKEIENLIEKIKGTVEKVTVRYGTGRKVKKLVKTGKKIKTSVIDRETGKHILEDEEIEKEFDEFIKKEESKYPIELVIANIKNKPKAIFQYYMIKDNSRTVQFQERLRKADKELKEVMQSETYKEVLDAIRENCSAELQILQNKVSTLL